MTTPNTLFLRTKTQRQWFLIATLGAPAAVALFAFYVFCFGWQTAVGDTVGIIIFRQLILGMIWLGGWVERGER